MVLRLTDDCNRAAWEAANAVIESERRNGLVDEPKISDTADTYVDELVPAPKATRKRLDQYYTPQPVADALVAHYLTRFPKPRLVLEPSVGKGAWARALNEQAQPERIVGVELEPQPDCFCDEVITGDFLSFVPALHESGRPDLIIGNPPYSGALNHVVHAIQSVCPGGHVALLLRLAFTESAARVGFWARHKPRLITVLAQRPSFTGGGVDQHAYGFFVWEDGYDGPSEVVPGFDWRNK